MAPLLFSIDGHRINFDQYLVNKEGYLGGLVTTYTFVHMSTIIPRDRVLSSII